MFGSYLGSLSSVWTSKCLLLRGAQSELLVIGLIVARCYKGTVKEASGTMLVLVYSREIFINSWA